MCSGSEEGSYLRLIDCCINQLMNPPRASTKFYMGTSLIRNNGSL